MDPHRELPTLEGSRIRLRQLGAGDVPALFSVFSDAQVMRYWSHAPLRTLDQADWYLRDIDAGRASGSHLQWGIAGTDDDVVFGAAILFAFDRTRLRAEIGYALAHAHWRDGYATEALGLLLAHAFTSLSLSAIEADVDERNAASRGLLEKLGFEDSGKRSLRSYAHEPDHHGIKYILHKYAFQALTGTTKP